MKLNYTFYIALFLITSNVTLAQKVGTHKEFTPKKSTTLTFAHQDIFHSNLLNEDRRINIFLPDDFYKTSSQHTYPVLLLLEDEFFLMVSGVVKHLSSVERMPETIVVSLVDGPIVPKLYTNGSDFWPQNWKQLPFGKDPDLFTKHLKEELFPYLKSNFRANDFKIVMGLSATSIYAIHTFAKENDLFDAHIAIAAGDILGMGYIEGESLIDFIIEDFENTQKKIGWLYITSADSDGNGNSPMIKANLEELEERLSPYRSNDFRFTSKIFPNEGHYDVALPGLEEALGLIFPKENWFSNYRELIKEPGNAMGNIDNYFKIRSMEYGFEILPKAERWNSGNSLSRIGPFLLSQGRTKEAIEVLERWVAYRPKSILALIELEKAYEAKNELNKALFVLKKAYNMALELEMDESNEYQAQINKLKAKILKERN